MASSAVGCESIATGRLRDLRVGHAFGCASRPSHDQASGRATRPASRHRARHDQARSLLGIAIAESRSRDDLDVLARGVGLCDRDQQAARPGGASCRRPEWLSRLSTASGSPTARTHPACRAPPRRARTVRADPRQAPASPPPRARADPSIAPSSVGRRRLSGSEGPAQPWPRPSRSPARACPRRSRLPAFRSCRAGLAARWRCSPADPRRLPGALGSAGAGGRQAS